MVPAKASPLSPELSWLSLFGSGAPLAGRVVLSYVAGAMQQHRTVDTEGGNGDVACPACACQCHWLCLLSGFKAALGVQQCLPCPHTVLCQQEPGRLDLLFTQPAVSAEEQCKRPATGGQPREQGRGGGQADDHLGQPHKGLLHHPQVSLIQGRILPILISMNASNHHY